MVYQEEKFPGNVYLTEENQAQSSPQTIYPDISDSQWGIDTLEFWVYVAPDDYQINQEWRETARTSKKGNKYSIFTRKYDYKGQVVSITINTIDTRCYFSLNAAKLMHSDPLSLLDPDLLSAEILLFLEAIKAEVAPSEVWNKALPDKPLFNEWQENVRVNRVDVARNFYLPDSLFRATLQNIPHFGKTSHTTIKSRQDGWSVSHQTKRSGKDMLYNKTAEQAVKHVEVQEGIYRFESQLRRGRRKNLNLRSISDINRLSIWTAIQARWDETKWGNQKIYGSLDSVIYQLFGSQACSIIGYLKLTQLGIKPKVSSKTAKKYQEAIDLALLESSLDSDESSIQSLDLFSGLQKPSSELQKQKGAPVNSDENSE
jgi:hypothetical protein